MNPKTLSSYRESVLRGIFEFLGDFWVYLRGVVFLERLVKLREIRNIKDLVKF